MVHSLLRWLTPAALFAAALAVAAQTAKPASKPDPLDPKANVPPLAYQSSFTQYHPLGDARPIAWREANDTVARIGGWRVYAREAQQPEPAPPAKAPAPTPAATPAEISKPMPMPQGHGGHKAP